MKLRIALLAIVAAAGVFASIAVAKPPQGHGNPHDQTTTVASTASTTATTWTTSTTPRHGKGRGHGETTTTTANCKVLVCHRVGNGHYVLISVSVHSAPAKGKHKGDVLAANRACPGPIQGHTGTTPVAHTMTTAATTTTTVATTTS